jgi:hypothetical protein
MIKQRDNVWEDIQNRVETDIRRGLMGGDNRMEWRGALP